LALVDVDVEIEAGSFFSILGPSGCGKTTLLRIIAGFEVPSAGRVVIGGVDVTRLSPRDRDIAMVFQDYALYPHMSVAQNIGFNLRNRRVPKRVVAGRVEETAEKLGIAHLLGKKPANLSGGERQRVALGRALVRQPRVFLLDEPLSNLDLKLREAMRIELGRLHQEFGITTVYVTHDQAEAMTLSTRLAVMRSGRVQQLGTPDEVYARPANTFVARFIGSPSMNLFRMRVEGEWLRGLSAGEVLPVRAGVAGEPGMEVLAGVRAHDLRVVDEGPGVAVRVAFSEHLGRNNFVVCEPVAGEGLLFEQDAIQVETPASVWYEPGTELLLSADPATIRLFTPDGDAIDGISSHSSRGSGEDPSEATAGERA
jgi:multiple sugar transport system ATP-binding protein